MQLKAIPHHWEARMAHLMEVEMAVNNWREDVLDLHCCKQDTKQALILECLPHHLEALRAHHLEVVKAVNERSKVRNQHKREYT